jgi:hypothetical protein
MQKKGKADDVGETEQNFKKNDGEKQWLSSCQNPSNLDLEVK